MPGEEPPGVWRYRYRGNHDVVRELEVEPVEGFRVQGLPCLLTEFTTHWVRGRHYGPEYTEEWESFYRGYVYAPFVETLLGGYGNVTPHRDPRDEDWVFWDERTYGLFGTHLAGESGRESARSITHGFALHMATERKVAACDCGWRRTKPGMHDAGCPARGLHTEALEVE